MSKIFYDRFIEFEEIEIELQSAGLSLEEKRELEQLIDEMVHHRVLDRLLTHLPKEHHQEFLQKFHKSPFDESLINYLNERIKDSVEKHIKEEVGKLKKEILEDLKSSRKNN